MNGEDDTTTPAGTVLYTEENGTASDDGALSAELLVSDLAYPIDQGAGGSAFTRSAFAFPGRVCHSDDSEVRRLYQHEQSGLRRIYHSLSDHGLYPYLSGLGLSTVASSEPGEASCLSVSSALHPNVVTTPSLVLLQPLAQPRPWFCCDLHTSTGSP